MVPSIIMEFANVRSSLDRLLTVAATGFEPAAIDRLVPHSVILEVNVPSKRLEQESDGQSIWLPAEPTELDLNSIGNGPVLLAAIRFRLSDISSWMRLLCQYIAMCAGQTRSFEIAPLRVDAYLGQYV